MNIMKKYFSMVVATTRKNGIGYKGKLPWKSIPRDMEHYKRIINWKTTTRYANPFSYLYQANIPNTREKIVVKGKRNALIMGKTTWDSLPSSSKSTSTHLNIIIDKQKHTADNVKVTDSIVSALDVAEKDPSIHEVIVIGGESVYNQAMKVSERCKAIFKTRVCKDFVCDKFFPEIPLEHFKLVHISKTYSCIDIDGMPIPFDFTFYVNSKLIDQGYDCIDQSFLELYPKHEEMQYLELVKKVIEEGNEKKDRTGTGTNSLFGSMMRFDLTESFPLLTTKSVYWKGVVEELLWFLRGHTNAKQLEEQGVKIWNANGSREYLDRVGLTQREEGDLGPIYGFQWRHFGAPYKTMHDTYKNQGVDQLADLLYKIKNTHDDRRMIMIAWNPAALKEMALPPCHLLSQFYVADNKLNCMMYQRSADLGLGVPFNIASYSLLTHILANATGKKAGEFVHILGDTHVYKNHIDPLKVQLQRYPNPFPILNVKKKLSDLKSIEELAFNDFELKEYTPHPKIKMELSC